MQPIDELRAKMDRLSKEVDKLCAREGYHRPRFQCPECGMLFTNHASYKLSGASEVMVRDFGHCTNCFFHEDERYYVSCKLVKLVDAPEDAERIPPGGWYPSKDKGVTQSEQYRISRRGRAESAQVLA